MAARSVPISETRRAWNAEDIIGTWRLRSWKNIGSDGSAVDPLGENPVGYIFYNHDGYMSVEIMAAHRVPYRTPKCGSRASRETFSRSAPSR
jgi:Lipocalin-like domain